MTPFARPAKEAAKPKSPLERLQDDAKGTLWCALYLTASYVLVTGYGLATGDWINASPEDSSGGQLFGNGLFLLMGALVAWRSWKAPSRWSGILVALWISVELIFRVVAVLGNEKDAGATSWFAPAMFGFLAWRGVVARFRLAKMTAATAVADAVDQPAL